MVAGMTNLLLVVAAIATLAGSIWLALEDSAALALPLVIVFAGLLRTIVRRFGRRGITPAEVAPPSHEEPRP
jgi:membrane protein implicated in regulation of membrane protease activity